MTQRFARLGEGAPTEKVATIRATTCERESTPRASLHAWTRVRRAGRGGVAEDGAAGGARGRRRGRAENVGCDGIVISRGRGDDQGGRGRAPRAGEDVPAAAERRRARSFTTSSVPGSTHAGDAKTKSAAHLDGWELTFSDEFDGDELDLNKWRPKMNESAPGDWATRRSTAILHASACVKSWTGRS